MTEEKENKTQEQDSKAGIIFVLCMAVGIGYYSAKTFDKEADIKIDFERKSYIPFSINNELYLINQKNGKTYLLEKHELENEYWYEYKFLGKTKTNKRKIYKKNNPLDLAF